LTLVLVIYPDGLPVRIQSPMQIQRSDRESNPQPLDG